MQDLLHVAVCVMAVRNLDRKSSKKKADGENKTKGDWNSWGGYMQAKVQKLEVQFKEDIPKEPQDVDASQIFEKVVIHINGYTVPPADELRRLVYLHGGRYQQYYTKRTVTHIIATNLPNSKIQELRDELVVHPSWILDSIKAARLLPVDEYLLYQGRKASQKVLNFTPKSSTCTTTKPPHGGLPTAATSTLQSPGVDPQWICHLPPYHPPREHLQCQICQHCL
ncbi:deoxycytidyl transferase [Desmophyllum pertusum]|uniref:Deoxycytidyl transferase n=1 Tax=Desmophyllum pertusum TaxID=174260 RepID=A0A9W9ZEU1_9CNID|nr:deoxycytidyl transferase [Desmophyllum pertusum]